MPGKVDSILQYTNGFIERKAVLDPDEAITYVYDGTGGPDHEEKIRSNAVFSTRS